MALRPAARPVLPQPLPGQTLTEARPSEPRSLADGDTLHLTAELVARTIGGRRYTMYGFNGQYPGPRLTVRQGTSVVVDFVNHLDQPTSIHWHGVRLDNAFDGTVGLTQSAVPSGGRFIYRVRFPDAGVYWYHPHVAEEMQQNLGLFADIVVLPAHGVAATRANREEVLILDDLLIGPTGLVPYGQNEATHALMGRFGNVLLVNGESRYERTVARGDVVRYLITNASNARTYNLSWPGTRLKLLGSDAGNFERETWVESVVIAPAERYVVAVRFDRPGTTFLLNRVQGLDHFFNRFFEETDTLGAIHVRSTPGRPDLTVSFDSLHLDRADGSRRGAVSG